MPEDESQARAAEMNTRGAAWLAGSACGLTLIMIVCTVGLSILNRSEVDQSFFVFILLSCVAVGGLVASRRPRNPIGWFFVVSAVFLALQSLTLEYATYRLITATPARCQRPRR